MPIIQEREKSIESYLRERVNALGGKAYKFVSPGNNGVPDRMVCLPGGKALFVELKGPGKKTTPLQERQINYLAGLGFSVWVIYSKDGVDEFIDFCKREVMPQ